MSRKRHPASTASLIASPVFSSRRDDERRQIGVAASGEDNRVGDDQVAASILDVEPVGAEDATVVDEQPRDIYVVAHQHADGSGALDEER